VGSTFFAETLKTVQSSERTPKSKLRGCCLYGDLLYHVAISYQSNGAIFKTYQLNKSSGQFETMQERKIESTTKCFDLLNQTIKVYVYDRYCIFDWFHYTSEKFIRHVEVRCINTVELIHERNFEYSTNIDKEYKGAIRTFIITGSHR